MSSPETSGRSWRLWSDENFALVARAREDYKKLDERELGRVFSNMLSDILLGLSSPKDIMRMLEKLGMTRYAAGLIQGKVSAGTLNPKVDIWGMYLLTYQHVTYVSGIAQMTPEAETLISNVITFDFSTHPFWGDGQ